MPRVPGNNCCRVGLLTLSLCLWACAEGPVIIDGKPVPRLQLELTGQPYTVRHIDAHPQPGGPSGGVSAQGGRITGVVCGTDIDYVVQHNGKNVTLSGFVGSVEINNQLISRMQITETLGFHTISGTLANREVRLELYGNRLRGYVAQCAFDMTQEDDSLTQLFYDGPVSKDNEMRLRLTGLEALWRMPAADQAAVLPIVVACMMQRAYENRGVADPPTVGFGGKPTAVPMNTLTLAGSQSAGLRYCRIKQTVGSAP